MTTLGGPTGLGSNLAEVQAQDFNNLVNYDCKRISNAMSRCAVVKCVRKMFNTDEVKCRFSFVEDEHISIKEYLEYATTLQQLGGTIDLQKLKELTKFDILADDVKDVWKPTIKDD